MVEQWRGMCGEVLADMAHIALANRHLSPYLAMSGHGEGTGEEPWLMLRGFTGRGGRAEGEEGGRRRRGLEWNGMEGAMEWREGRGEAGEVESTRYRSSRDE